MQFTQARFKKTTFSCNTERRMDARNVSSEQLEINASVCVTTCLAQVAHESSEMGHSSEAFSCSSTVRINGAGVD